MMPVRRGRLIVAGAALLLTACGTAEGVHRASSPAVHYDRDGEVHRPASIIAPARATRSHVRAQLRPQARPHPVHTPSTGFSTWRGSHAYLAVRDCESGGDYGAVSHTGKYRGAWQMDASFWSTYGGLKYASRPELATPLEQDMVAYRGYLSRGWQPWSCRKEI